MSNIYVATYKSNIDFYISGIHEMSANVKSWLNTRCLPSPPSRPLSLYPSLYRSSQPLLPSSHLDYAAVQLQKPVKIWAQKDRNKTTHKNSRMGMSREGEKEREWEGQKEREREGERGREREVERAREREKVQERKNERAYSEGKDFICAALTESHGGLVRKMEWSEI